MVFGHQVTHSAFRERPHRSLQAVQPRAGTAEVMKSITDDGHEGASLPRRTGPVR